MQLIEFLLDSILTGCITCNCEFMSIITIPITVNSSLSYQCGKFCLSHFVRAQEGEERVQPLLHVPAPTNRFQVTPPLCRGTCGNQEGLSYPFYYLSWVPQGRFFFYFSLWVHLIPLVHFLSCSSGPTDATEPLQQPQAYFVSERGKSDK